MNQIQNDEIGLFDFFHTLWDRKKTIGASIILTFLLSTLYILLKEPEHESRLFYKADSMPPFYESADHRIPMKDFEKLFHSKSLFDKWKKLNKNSKLVYSDFSKSEKVDGILVSRHEDNRVALLDKEKKDSELYTYILVRSDKLVLLDDFYNYANYINNVLTSEYILRSKEEIEIIDKRFNDFSSTTDIITSKLLAIDRYIVAAKSGANVLIFSRPEYPVQVWPKINLLFAISFVLGFMLGIIYIFFSDANRQYKEQLSKSSNSS